MKQNPTLVQSQRDKNVQKIVPKKLLGVRTRHLQVNTLRLNHSATATFAAHCILFLVYKWILKLNQLNQQQIYIVKIIDLHQRNSRRFYECSIKSLEKCTFYQSVFNLNILRHTVVCSAAQENGAYTIGVSILTGTTKLRFHASVAL